MSLRPSLLFLLILSSCTVDLSLPGGSAISCSDDNECPPDQRCSVSLERCVPKVANQAPSVVIAPVVRSVGDAKIRITLFDEESNETTLATRLIVGGRFIDLPAQILASAPEGTVHELPLTLSELLASAAFEPAVSLELTPRDATGIGATVVSEPFAFGNDAPALTQVQLLGQGGVLAVSLVVNDSSADPVSITGFEYSLDGFATATSVTLDAAHFNDLNLLSQIETEGDAHTFFWNTAELAITTSLIQVRCKVQDAFGADSNWLESAPLSIDNSPQLTLLGVPTSFRPLQTIDFVVDAFDPNVPLSETMQLQLAYANLAEPMPTWHAMTLAPQYVVNPFTPGRTTLHWDALAQTVDGPASVSLPTSVMDGPPAPTQILGYMSALAIRAQLTDSAGLSSAQQIITVGEVGNNAPSAVIASVAKDANVAISVTVADSSGDPADLEVEFKQKDDLSFRKAALVLSNTSELATSPGGVTHLVLWNSTAAPSGNVDAPQGVGFNNADDVQLRVRARDHAGGSDVAYLGEWSAPLAIGQVSNQSPPRVDQVSIERLIDSDGSGPVAIRYVLIDQESDPVDVAFEISIDGGPFGPCPEYPSPLSEDTRDQMSSPEGVQHVFVWNPTADRVQRAGAIELRISARDAKAENNTSTKRLFPRPAQGSFQSRYVLNDPHNFNFQETGFFVEAGDVNGDGITDTVLIETTGPVVQVYLGTGSRGVGNGAFVSGPSGFYCGDYLAPGSGGCPTGSPPRLGGMELADLDGDGNEDAVMAALDGSIWLLRGTGLAGTNQDSFTMPASRLMLDGNTDELSGVRVAELNGDGHNDIAVTTATGELAIYLGGPTGPTGYELSLAARLPISVRANKILAHDVDADGDTDLIVVGDDMQPVNIAINGVSGTTGFAIGATVAMPYGIDPLALALLDVNGDAALDLAVARVHEVLIFAGQTTPPFFVLSDTLLGPDYDVTLSVGDVNNDGFDDLLATERSLTSARNAVEVYFGRGLGLAPLTPLFELPIRARNAVTGLFNGDDIPDVAFMLDDIVNFGDDLRIVSAISEKAPSGPVQYFSDERTLELLDLPPYGIENRIRDGDFNGDGIVDLVFSGPSPMLGSSGNISVMLGEGRAGFGSGTFAPPLRSFETSALVSQLEVADLNGDHLDDIVLVRGAELVIALSDGSASFAATSTRTLEDGTSALVVADMTNDGIADLLVGNSISTAGLSLFAGNGTLGMGDGTFAALPTLIDTGTKEVSTVVTGYFDADGFLDVIFRSPMTDVHLLRGIGAGGFAAEEDLSGDVGATLRAVDINHDGFLDLLSSGGDFGTPISIRLGQGTSAGPDGTFANAVTYAGHPQVSLPGPVYLTDVDLDGVNDLIAFTQNKREIMMLKGLVGPSGPSGFAPAKVLLTGTGVAPVSLVVRDFNGDDIPDWAVIDQETPMVSFWFGQYQRHQAFSQVVRDNKASKVRPFGAGVTEPDSGLMANNLGSKSVIMRPAFTQNESHAVDAWNSLLAADHTVAPGSRAITEPWVIDGFQKVRRVLAPLGVETYGPRLQLFNRFGPLQTPPERAGLSLAQNRGLVVSLPLNGRLDHGSVNDAINSQRVVVYKQSRRFLTSVDVSDDPLNDARYLPRGRGALLGDRILKNHSWSTLPFDADGFGSGTGERFVVSLAPLGARTQLQSDIAKGSVDVLIDEPGTFQAFVVP